MKKKISLIAFFFLISVPFSKDSLFAKEFSITEINAALSEEKELITVKFLSEYPETPSVTFGSGWARVSFPNASYDSELNRVRINDGFVNNIRFFPMINGSLMEIEFTDSKTDRSNYLDFISVNGNIELAINRNAPITEEPLTEKDVAQNTLDETNDSISGKKELFTGNSGIGSKVSGADNNWSGYTLRIAIFLAILLGICYLLLRLYKKYLRSDFSFAALKGNIKVISSFFLGPKQKIMIISINGKNFALGVAGTSISLISRIEDNELGEFEQLAKENANLSLGELRSKYQIRKQNKNDSESISKKPPKKKFADELQSRLKKLKPLN